MAIDMATILDTGPDLCLRPEGGGLVRSRHPHGTSLHPPEEAIGSASRGPGRRRRRSWRSGSGAIDRLVASDSRFVPPDESHADAGRGLQAADFRLLRPCPQGSRTAWFSGAFACTGRSTGTTPGFRPPRPSSDGADVSSVRTAGPLRGQRRRGGRDELAASASRKPRVWGRV